MPFGGKDKDFYLLMVRGKADSGTNKFVDQRSGTILDEASGMDWTKALDYCETLVIDGNDNWPYWSSTTHYSLDENNGIMGGYIAFGRSISYMDDQ